MFHKQKLINTLRINMQDKDITKIFMSIVIASTVLLGGCIAANIMATQSKKELVKTALEKGQNPLYVKCAMEDTSSNECKTMMTVIAISRSDK